MMYDPKDAADFIVALTFFILLVGIWYMSVNLLPNIRRSRLYRWFSALGQAAPNTFPGIGI